MSMSTSITSNDDRRAARQVLSCVSSVVAVALALWALTAFNAWPAIGSALAVIGSAIIGSAIMMVANVLDPIALSLTILAACSLATGLCLISKGVADNPGQGAARWRHVLHRRMEAIMVASFVLAVAMGMLALFSAVRGGSATLAEYQEVLQVKPSELSGAGLEMHDNWTREMGRSGVVVRNQLRSTCLKVAAVPVGEIYTLTINGKPADPANCGWGLNIAKWQVKSS